MMMAVLVKEFPNDMVVCSCKIVVFYIHYKGNVLLPLLWPQSNFTLPQFLQSREYQTRQYTCNENAPGKNGHEKRLPTAKKAKNLTLQLVTLTTKWFTAE